MERREVLRLAPAGALFAASCSGTDSPAPAADGADGGAATTAAPTGAATTDGSAATFVFNSGGAQRGNRYNVWSDFAAAVAAAEYGQKALMFEQDERIPGGTFDMNGGTIWGTGRRRVTLTFEDGAKIANPAGLLASHALILHSVSTEPIIDMTEGMEVILDAGTIMCSSSSPFIRMSATEGATLVSLRNSHIFLPSEAALDDGDCESIEITGTPEFAGIASVVGSTTVSDGTVRGNGSVTHLINTSGTRPTKNIHPGLTAGKLVEVIGTFAVSVGFDDASAALGVDDVQGAIDAICARLTAAGVAGFGSTAGS